jgi:drug/metabolite transporter (DMT)-like permease
VARNGVVRCLVAAVLFGASAPAASRLAGEMPTLVLAGLLYVGAALAVAPAALSRAHPARALTKGGRPLAVAVVFGGALGPALLVAGLVRIPAATASLLLNFELVATAVIAAVVFHEHLGRRLLAAIALVTAAGVILVWRPGATVELAGLLVVGACICWGIDNSTTARIDQLSPEQITFAKGAVAGTANLVLGLIIMGARGLTVAHVIAALGIGSLGYGVSIVLWVRGARELGAARGQVIFATAPFVGAVISWIVLGEPVVAYQLVALAIAAAGVALSLGTGHTHAHRHERLDHEHEHSHDDGHHTHVHTPPVTGRHTHRHRHEPIEHAHPHMPDLHHGHRH